MGFISKLKRQYEFRQYRKGYVFRSEARWMLARLDQFTEVLLDFSKVNRISQGFSDEVFRVYALQHPDMTFEVLNANDAVKAMIQHVIDTASNVKL